MHKFDGRDSSNCWSKWRLFNYVSLLNHEDKTPGHKPCLDSEFLTTAPTIPNACGGAPFILADLNLRYNYGRIRVDQTRLIGCLIDKRVIRFPRRHVVSGQRQRILMLGQLDLKYHLIQISK